MEEDTQLKFTAHIVRKEPPLTEGTVTVWARNKKSAKKQIQKSFPNYIILDCKVA